MCIFVSGRFAIKICSHRSYLVNVADARHGLDPDVDGDLLSTEAVLDVSHGVLGPFVSEAYDGLLDRDLGPLFAPLNDLVLYDRRSALCAALKVELLILDAKKMPERSLSPSYFAFLVLLVHFDVEEELLCVPRKETVQV